MRKSYRVKKEADFQKVFEKHDSVANRQFVVYQLEKPGQKHFRIGISVGKKIGNAVHRNWVKRRIRQSITELKPDLRTDVDFLVIARPRADGMSQKDVKASLIHVLKLAHLLDSDYSEE
ncbi:ribonuclease P protein component [Fructilactobacillus fructivorans]|uniref:Ribonuclease P protein component n=1 Tax=Fructilactobacillus fructivorans TaxID=1614 RepID=A0A0C1PRD8_9LACO|nr:ribonuclease P protein component [Fructilactobacillus fructivorans]KID42451.1 Ribonuclease P protein component [Fructilactobacillus fructivorans]MCT0150937.1 ribonuclease P protein component [Fructilactobacillus fructivorans]MCT2867506.1 ribonuclease P protein component [Fructilactobacillus fructivorans]MCT2868976.1 ribonuclease P protein component [Fructilactobacillus fructivorans]MCT2873305.1 ribonuclease P protein component [Fructilactobacillus fructivorans]